MHIKPEEQDTKVMDVKTELAHEEDVLEHSDVGDCKISKSFIKGLSKN
jgi:hypothetical protein